MAASLAKRGYSILADDVCAINADGEILPSFPQIKLWADAAKQLSYSIAYGTTGKNAAAQFNAASMDTK